jgi:putative DNA primase/helicase
MSAHEAITDFIGFMESAGVCPDEPIAQRLATGSLIRFRCEGDGKGRQNGWAILYLDERPAGAFGNYRLNTGTLKWKSHDNVSLTSDEREAMQREWQAQRERRDAERLANERQAAMDAAEMWERATAASADHPYVAAKKLDPAPLRQIGDTLLVPMFDGQGNAWNLQRIRPDGSKRFLRGGRVDDLFNLIGDASKFRASAVIGEGYSTVAAIHQATGQPCIAAFTAANIIRVARLWNNMRPDIDYTIFADDDAATAEKPPFKNVGRQAAEAAALEIGARVAVPLGRVA